jgi:hypothetical protein
MRSTLASGPWAASLDWFAGRGGPWTHQPRCVTCVPHHATIASKTGLGRETPQEERCSTILLISKLYYHTESRVITDQSPSGGPYILASLTLVMHWPDVLVDRKIEEREIYACKEILIAESFVRLG